MDLQNHRNFKRANTPVRNYRIDDLMRIFGVGRSTIYDWLNKDLLPKPITIGRTPVFMADEIDAFVEAKKAARG